MTLTAERTSWTGQDTHNQKKWYKKLVANLSGKVPPKYFELYPDSFINKVRIPTKNGYIVFEGEHKGGTITQYYNEAERHQDKQTVKISRPFDKRIILHDSSVVVYSIKGS